MTSARNSARRRRSRSNSQQWAADYNEIKELGASQQPKRTAQQTEDARFWLASGGNIYYPMVRALAEAKKLSLIDSARLYRADRSGPGGRA